MLRKILLFVYKTINIGGNTIPEYYGSPDTPIPKVSPKTYPLTPYFGPEWMPI